MGKRVRVISQPYTFGDPQDIFEWDKVYTVKTSEETSTGTWLSFEELDLNKYGGRNYYLSLHFEEVDNPWEDLL